jgi:hypothetical protein
MDNAYGIVIGVILLFPWFIMAIMVTGALWTKVRTFARFQSRSRSGEPLLQTQASWFHSSRVTLAEREALPQRNRAQAISN